MTGTWLRPRLGRPDQMLLHSCALVGQFQHFLTVFANNRLFKETAQVLPCNLPSQSHLTQKSQETQQRKSQTQSEAMPLLTRGLNQQPKNVADRKRAT